VEMPRAKTREEAAFPILDYLEENPYGASIMKIAKETKLDKRTTMKWLNVLKREDKVFHFRLGSSKVYRLTKYRRA